MRGPDRRTAIFLLLGAVQIWPAFAVENDKSLYVGSTSCQTSGCHGGAGERGQSLIWQEKDYHSRARAILVTARSLRMAETLQIGDPLASARCTICHSPQETLSPGDRQAGSHPDQAVSCETCHGAAAGWLRPHTRKDFSHKDRVGEGMRDLRNLYVRAGTCVACHLNLPPDVLSAGHPELAFELDGQTLSEPPHWQEKIAFTSPQAWLTGQAVALREMSWELEKRPSPELQKRWSALLWLLRKLSGDLPDFPILEKTTPPEVRLQADSYARKSATYSWNHALAARTLRTLAAGGLEFTTENAGETRRADALVVALDRLLPAAGLPADLQAKCDSLVSRLFASVQSPQDFDRSRFSSLLDELSQTLANP